MRLQASEQQTSSVFVQQKIKLEEEGLVTCHSGFLNFALLGKFLFFSGVKDSRKMQHGYFSANVGSDTQPNQQNSCEGFFDSF